MPTVAFEIAVNDSSFPGLPKGSFVAFIKGAWGDCQDLVKSLVERPVIGDDLATAVKHATEVTDAHGYLVSAFVQTGPELIAITVMKPQP